MKLNLEKNFKSLFKKKVSFTMAALTIFAITGAVSLADPGTPGGTPDPNATIKELEKRVGANADNIKSVSDKFDKFSKDQNELNDKYEQAVDNVGTKADQAWKEY